MNSDHDSLRERHELDEILARFGLNVFEWLCLDASAHWHQWGCALGYYIFKNIEIEKFWDHGIYLPDITDSKMLEADQAIRASGLVSQVDNSLARAMIAERTVYDTGQYAESELCGLRVLSATGAAVWNNVRELQGSWTGMRFIKALAISHSFDSQMVFHSPREFRLNLLCETCAEAARKPGSGCFTEVGPWFNPDDQLWLSGWRLICPHCV